MYEGHGRGIRDYIVRETRMGPQYTLIEMIAQPVLEVGTASASDFRLHLVISTTKASIKLHHYSFPRTRPDSL